MTHANQTKGKRFEQKVAAAHPLFRRYTRKSYGELAPDVLHPLLVIECKSRTKIAAIRFLEQAESYISDGRIAWVVMKEANKRQPEWVVMMRFNDALAMLEVSEIFIEENSCLCLSNDCGCQYRIVADEGETHWYKCGLRGESCTE